MARLLMIESWIGSAGEALPRVLRARGDRFVLLTRDRDRYDAVSHPASALADGILEADTHDPAATAAAAEAAHLAQPFDGVLTTCDHYVELVAVVARRLRLPGAEPAAAHTALRKDLVRAAIDRAGLPNPRFATAATLSEAQRCAHRLGYPLIAKPVDLHSGTLVRRVADDADLAEWFREADAVDRNSRGQERHRAVLLEELLAGEEVSVETATYGGETTVLGVTDKSITGAPGFVESGHQFPADLDDATAKAAAALVHDALAAVGWSHGVAHTEVMLTAGGPRIVEINPRQGGNHIFELMRLVTGYSTLDAVVDLAVGRPPGPIAPRGARPASAAVHFVMTPVDGKLIGVRGTADLDATTAVARWVLPHSYPVDVRRPRDNEDYIGYVIAVDHGGRGARRCAEQAVADLRLVFDGGAEARPLGLGAAASIQRA